MSASRPLPSPHTRRASTSHASWSTERSVFHANAPRNLPKPMPPIALCRATYPTCGPMGVTRMSRTMIGWAVWVTFGALACTQTHDELAVGDLSSAAYRQCRRDGGAPQECRECIARGMTLAQCRAPAQPPAPKFGWASRFGDPNGFETGGEVVVTADHVYVSGIVGNTTADVDGVAVPADDGGWVASDRHRLPARRDHRLDPLHGLRTGSLPASQSRRRTEPGGR